MLLLFSLCWYSTFRMTRAFAGIIFLLASCTIVETAEAYYEEISGNNGNTYIEDSMQRTPVTSESLHTCSISEHCNYVVQNLTNGHFSLYSNTANLPSNMTGLCIWKKSYQGREKFKGSVLKYFCFIPE